MDDKYYMDLAIDMARKTKGQTSPNPMVGAIVVKNGRIVGMGAHLRAGEPHAEVHALNMAGKEAEGSTIYVTLEPCSHHGKTPPCAERIVKEKVKRVVVATLDPNPLVSGSGVDLIEKAGIKVTVGVLKDEAKRLNEVFNKYITTRLPYVTVKTAMTLDGKIATSTGSSKWITGEKARAFVHELRHQHDAIMVGIGTVMKDNPSLTVRMEQEGIHPIRVIIDSDLRLPLDYKLVTDQEAPTWVFTASNVNQEKIEALQEKGVKVITTSESSSVSLEEVMKYLGEKQITSVFVEGGAKIIGSLFDKKLIDKYIGFIAPKLVGGINSPTSIGGKGIEEMKNAVSLEDISIETYGNDLCIIGYTTYSSDLVK